MKLYEFCILLAGHKEDVDLFCRAGPDIALTRQSARLHVEPMFTHRLESRAKSSRRNDRIESETVRAMSRLALGTPRARGTDH